MGVMENRTAPQIVEKFQDLYKPALVTNWQVWPAAQYINFRFMPLAYRVPFQSSCGVFWTLYLSTINSKYVPRSFFGDIDTDIVAERTKSKIIDPLRLAVLFIMYYSRLVITVAHLVDTCTIHLYKHPHWTMMRHIFA